MSIAKHPLGYAVSGLTKGVRRLGFRFRLYRSWAEAAQEASYENNDLLEYRARKAEIMVREERYRDFENPGIDHLRLGVLWLQSLGRNVHVVDFGGSFGEEGLALISDPLLGPDLTYIICESPGVRERAERLNLPPQIQFVDDLSQAGGCDIFYSSCAFPYVPEPAAILDQALHFRPYFFILVRNCFSERELVRIQASPLFNNGPQGIEVPGFNNHMVRYPHHTQNLSALRSQLESSGYRLVGSYAEDSGVYPYGDEVFGRDLIFADIAKLMSGPKDGSEPVTGRATEQQPRIGARQAK